MLDVVLLLIRMFRRMCRGLGRLVLLCLMRLNESFLKMTFFRGIRIMRRLVFILVVRIIVRMSVLVSRLVIIRVCLRMVGCLVMLLIWCRGIEGLGFVCSRRGWEVIRSLRLRGWV